MTRMTLTERTKRAERRGKEKEKGIEIGRERGERIEKEEKKGR